MKTFTPPSLVKRRGEGYFTLWAAGPFFFRLFEAHGSHYI